MAHNPPIYMLSQSPVLFAAWTAWCLFHSLLASRRVKRLLTSRPTSQGYRIGYVLFSSITLMALVFWNHAVLVPAAQGGWPWQLIRLILVGYGLWMLYAGGKAYDLKEFLGLGEFSETAEETITKIKQDGILARVRHPWYSGGIALVIALGNTPLDLIDWRGLLIAYLIIGCLIEEQRLVSELGEVYRRYRREVPMLLPLHRNQH
ncbi:MAG: isoprenylcysteine carboxylmethyltransferase family protein [Proteobacteria bacterium]|nr:isoprenylcysteine carboxylmethyltransferase family protein [Pseudomonadota bacterium]MBU1686335.1 isoprenylcysteine carboxylmethyltransferase family protein [Pseudomonadota bacterium]